MKKIISVLLIFLLLTSILLTNYSFGGEKDEDDIDDIKKIKQAMQSIGTPSEEDKTSGTVNVINSVIGIMQIAGSGISLIVITLLGIKYIIASPSEKADVKKNIMPILIGCVLLFAAVNIISMVESFSTATFEENTQQEPPEKTV